MKHTHSFSESFQDKEHRLIHLLEDGNPPLPAIEADGPEQKETTDKPKTEKLDAQSTPEDVKSAGETALADAEKGSTDLQDEVKKAQEDVNRIRLAAALGNGSLTAEEEHSAAEERLAEAQAKALMEDHNPMSGGEAPPRELNLEVGIADATNGESEPEIPATNVVETHEQKPDTINEVEGVLEDVNEKTDHVTETEVKGGGGDDAGGVPVEAPTQSEGGTPSEGSTSQEQKEDPVASLEKAKNATDSAWQKFMEARDGYFKSQAGAKESAENSAKEAVDGLLQAVDAEEALMREVGDGKGGEQDASRWHEINGRHKQALAFMQQNEEMPAAKARGTPEAEKKSEAAPEETTLEPTGDIMADLRKAAEIYKNPEQRDKAFLFLIQALLYWMEGKKSDATSSAENAPASTTESQLEKGSEASTEQNDVIHGPARRARLINAYRAEEKKQPGMTATEFIAMKEDSIQKDEERLTEENDNLSKEEKNVKERVDILKSKRDSADPAARGPLETQIADAEKELKEIDAKIVANKDATEKLQDRKNDIVVLKELREKLKTLQDALKELPKDVLDNLNDAQRDVLNAFIKGVDAETYTVNFPTEDQINQLPTNAQDIIRNSTFYKQKDVYSSTITPASAESKATTLPNPIEPSEAAKKALEK